MLRRHSLGFKGSSCLILLALTFLPFPALHLPPRFFQDSDGFILVFPLSSIRSDYAPMLQSTLFV